MPVERLPGLSVNAQLIQDRIAQVRSQIPAQVQIMAVSKGYTPDHIRAAYAVGIRHFGESRVQEALQKQDQLQDCPEICWHLIGHLQTNKVKLALQRFSWIDSVDSWKLAALLNEKATELHCRPQLCLQVKLAPDPDKYGWEVEDLWNLLPQLDQLDQVLWRGLMTILPLGLSEASAFQIFQNLHSLADQINQTGLPHLRMEVLSMGMSGDYLLAVAAGSTQIRLGRALFAAS
jgi:hypothetical protein